MQVVLLAAGLGSRLGTLTERVPKALIVVGERTLLERALAFAARVAPTRVVVVGGFGYALVAAELERLAGRPGPALPVRLVENTRFREGNLISLMAARTERTWVDEDFLLLNVDHIFRPAIAELVQPQVEDVTAFIDTDRTLGGDDMKVERDTQGRVKTIAKTLTAYDCGYVGMTRVPGPALARYFAEVDAALAAEGTAIHVERVLARLAQGQRPPACRDISGHCWLEVDTPDERARAEEALREPGWD